MEIKKAEFLISSPTIDKCPKDNRIEYTFIGRSGIGKSNLIDILCNHKGLSRTSSTPGKALLINHFLVSDKWYLVDLPGYGSARRSKKAQADIEEMTNTYILQQKRLVNLFALVNVCHEQQKIDRAFIDWLGENEVPFIIMLTKADKLDVMKVRANATQWMERLRDAWEELPPYFTASSEKQTGRGGLLAYIDEISQSLL